MSAKAQHTTWTPELEAELRTLVLIEWHKQQAREATCKGKDGFDTPQQARASKPRREIHGRITAYKCRVCRKWHIGSHVGKSRSGRPRVEE